MLREGREKKGRGRSCGILPPHLPKDNGARRWRLRSWGGEREKGRRRGLRLRAPPSLVVFDRGEGWSRRTTPSRREKKERKKRKATGHRSLEQYHCPTSMSGRTAVVSKPLKESGKKKEEKKKKKKRRSAAGNTSRNLFSMNRVIVRSQRPGREEKKKKERGGRARYSAALYILPRPVFDWGGKEGGRE